MKRLEINAIIRDAGAFFRKNNFHLPPFAYWSPAYWKSKNKDVSEIVENQLGWDIPDFRSDDFPKTGLFLFTIRNGRPENIQ
jgi:D-lyxose ketol-isomerase